jgi:hypothetical protein
VTVVDFSENEVEPFIGPVTTIEFTEAESEPIVGGSEYADALDYDVTADVVPQGDLAQKGTREEVPYTRVTSSPVRSGDVPQYVDPVGGLTEEHRRLLSRRRIPAERIDPWDTADAAKAFQERSLSSRNVSKFLAAYKDQWVHAHRNVIKAAAKEYGLPEYLLGGVAWIEVGGDPPLLDEAGNIIRQYFAGDPGLTSFGPVQIQLGRAAVELGYDPDRLSSIQRRVLIWTLTDPQNDLFVVASHLSRIKKIDAPNQGPNEITDYQIRLIGARYNRGLELSMRALTTLGTKTSYGDSILRHRQRVEELLLEAP